MVSLLAKIEVCVCWYRISQLARLKGVDAVYTHPVLEMPKVKLGNLVRKRKLGLFQQS